MRNTEYCVSLFSTSLHTDNDNQKIVHIAGLRWNNPYKT